MMTMLSLSTSTQPYQQRIRLPSVNDIFPVSQNYKPSSVQPSHYDTQPNFHTPSSVQSSTFLHSPIPINAVHQEQSNPQMNHQVPNHIYTSPQIHNHSSSRHTTSNGSTIYTTTTSPVNTTIIHPMTPVELTTSPSYVLNTSEHRQQYHSSPMYHQNSPYHQYQPPPHPHQISQFREMSPVSSMNANKYRIAKQTTRQSNAWSYEDDCLLKYLKEVRNLGWREISMHFKNRTANGCQFRWRRIVALAKTSTNNNNNNTTISSEGKRITETEISPSCSNSSSPLPDSSLRANSLESILN